MTTLLPDELNQEENELVVINIFFDKKKRKEKKHKTHLKVLKKFQGIHWKPSDNLNLNQLKNI